MGILGIGVAVLGLLLGVYQIVLILHCPGKFTFIQESFVSLLDAAASNLSDLGITYKGRPVGRNLFFLKGFLLNSGYKDIRSDMVDQPVTATLFGGFRWLDARVVASSSIPPRVHLDRDEQTLSFILESGRLWKRREYLAFDALLEPIEPANGGTGAQLDGGQTLEIGLAMACRIADTKQDLDRRFMPLRFKPLALPIIGTLLTVAGLIFVPTFTLFITSWEAGFTVIYAIFAMITLAFFYFYVRELRNRIENNRLWDTLRAKKHTLT